MWYIPKVCAVKTKVYRVDSQAPTTGTSPIEGNIGDRTIFGILQVQAQSETARRTGIRFCQLHHLRVDCDCIIQTAYLPNRYREPLTFDGL